MTDQQFAKWGWKVRERQSFMLTSEHGMPWKFIRAAERAIMDVVGLQTGKWSSRIPRVEPSAESTTISVKRAGGDTIQVTVPGWKAS